jgi:hypothetical protein
MKAVLIAKTRTTIAASDIVKASRDRASLSGATVTAFRAAIGITIARAAKAVVTMRASANAGAISRDARP